MPDTLAVPLTDSALFECLARVFGFRSFRPGQEQVIEAVLADRDVLAIMPTGGGKSLCYQLPAVYRPGLTVVVSPLIALMRDQVAQLREMGVPVGSLNSGNDDEENRATWRGVRDGQLCLLYLAPERLVQPTTLELVRGAGVRLVAIDEAHCVSQWGHDFRPEYLALQDLGDWLPGVPIMAVTATADAATRADIAGRLFPRDPMIYVAGFDRPNLTLAMSAKSDGRRQVQSFVNRHRGESGIIYCGSRKKTESLAETLSQQGLPAIPYHAGLEPDVRSTNQARFSREPGCIVVATIAFGMGIDKPDVRFVVHADLPKTIESYYQEIGRAGRDGLPAETLTLYGMDDIQRRRRQIDESEIPDEQKRIERQRFNALMALCEAPRCRRQILLAYFGERTDPCGNCDLCLKGVETVDGTTAGRKALSAIARTGERFGTEHLVSILLGEATDAVQRFGHDRLPTFGVGNEHDRNQWRSIFRQLYAAGHLDLDIVERGRWLMTGQGRELMRGRLSFEMRRDMWDGASGTAERKKKQKSGLPALPQTPLQPADKELMAALKTLRLSLAETGKVPAYVIFPDSTLYEMVRRRPGSLEALHTIPGVGETKLARYGAAFLAVLEEHGADRGPLPAAEADAALDGLSRAEFERLAEAVAAVVPVARTWADVQNGLAGHDLRYTESGTGVALHRLSTGERLCAASKVGPGYGELVRHLGAPMPGHRNLGVDNRR